MSIQSSHEKKLFALPLVLLIFFFSGAHAQNNQETRQHDLDIYLKVYYQSAALGDVKTEINALHYLTAGDPGKYSSWLDTLALLYLRDNDFQQAQLLSISLLNTRGYSDLREEIHAVCAKELLQAAEAIEAYSILYARTNKPAYGFEKLRLQYAIRRLTETVVTATGLLQKVTTTNKDFVNVIKCDGKSSQRVSLKAAICEILGLAYLDLKDPTNAASQFDAALKENPEFEMAKRNLVSAQAIVDTLKK